MRSRLPPVNLTKILVGESPPYSFIAEVFTLESAPEPDHVYLVRHGLGGHMTSVYSVTFDERDRTVKVGRIKADLELLPALILKFTEILRSLWLGAAITYV